MSERSVSFQIVVDSARARRNIRQTQRDLEDLQETVEEVDASTTRSSTNADRSARRNTTAQNASRRATEAAAEAQGDLTDAVEEHTVAETALSRALRLTAEAGRRATEQAERHRVANQGETQSTQQLTRAQEVLAAAMLARQRASLNLESAQVRLAAAEQRHGADSQQYANALLAVQRRQLDAEAAANRHTRALGALGGMLEDVGDSARAGGGGIGTGAKAIKSAGDNARRAMPAFRGLNLAFLAPIAKMVAMATAVGYLITALSNLTAAVFGLLGPLASLGGLLGALPQYASVAAGAIGTLVAGFSGLGDALKAGIKMQESAGQAAKDQAKAEKDAARAVADAARGVRNAKEAQKEAAEQAAEAIKDANKAVRDSEWDLIDAIEATAEARKQATQDIKDQETALRDLEFAQRRASIGVEEAKARLAEVMNDPGSSDLDRKSAQLDYEEAIARLDDARKERGKSKKELAEAKKDGVNGSDVVKSAVEAEAEAREGLKESIEAEADARKDAAKSARDAAEAVAAAQRAYNDALENQGEVMAQVNADAAAYQKAMENLSPAAQRFVKTLMGMRDELKRLRFAAQEGLLPGVESGMIKLLKLVPLLEKGLFNFGQIIGNSFDKAAAAATSDEFLPMFRRLLKSNEKVLQDTLDTFGYLAKALVYLMDAARPFTEWIARGIKDWAKGRAEIAKIGNETGTTAAFFDRLKDTLRLLGDSFGNLWGTFKNISKAGREFSTWMLESFRDITQGWEDWTGSVKGQNELKEWFEEAKGPLSAMSSLLGTIMREVFDFGRENSDSLAIVIKRIEEVVPLVGDLLSNLQGDFGIAMVDGIAALIEILTKLTEAGTGGLTLFMETLAGFFDLVSRALDIPGVSEALAELALVLGGLAAIQFIGFITGITRVIRLVSGLGGLTGVIARFRGGIALLARMGPMLASLLLSPVGLIIAAIAALAVVGVVLYKKWEPFRNMVNELWETFKKDLLPVLKEVGTEIMGSLVEAGKEIADTFKKDLLPALEELWKVLKPAGKQLGAVAIVLVKAWGKYAKFMIGTVLPAVVKLAGFFLKYLIPAIAGVIKGIIKWTTGVVKVITGFIKIIKGIFTGDWKMIWDGVVDIFKGAWGIITGIFGIAKATWGAALKALWAVVKKVFGAGISAVGSLLKKAWALLYKVFIKPWVDAYNWLKKKWTEFRKLFEAGVRVVRDLLTRTWSKITDLFMRPVDAARDGIKTALSKVGEFFSSMWEGIKRGAEGFKTGLENIWNSVKNIFGEPIEFIVNTMINDWIIGGLNKILDPLGIPIEKIPEVNFDKKARGGSVAGQGNRDSVPTMLMPGEFVMRRDAVQNIGVNRLHALNEGRTFRGQKFAKGGKVKRDPNFRPVLPPSPTRPAGSTSTPPTMPADELLAQTGAFKSAGDYGKVKNAILASMGAVWDKIEGWRYKIPGPDMLKDMGLGFGEKAYNGLRQMVKDFDVSGLPKSALNKLVDVGVNIGGFISDGAGAVGGAISGGLDAIGFAKGGFVPRKRKSDIYKPRSRKFEGRFGDASIQHFATGGLVQPSSGPVLGMKAGAKGYWVKALEDLVGVQTNGTWDPQLNSRLKRFTGAPPTAFNPTRRTPNFVKWIKSAKPKDTTTNKKYTALPGDTVGGILRDFFGKKGARGHLQSFLKANGFTKTVKDTKTTRVPASDGGSAALNKALSFAGNQSGKPYVWGGVGPDGYDCSGYMSAITNVLKGNNPYSRLFATGSMSAALPGLGFRPGMGDSNDFSVGWYTGSPGHTAGTLGRLNVESTGNHVRNGSAAKGAAAFTQKAHLPLGGGDGSTTKTSTFTKTIGTKKFTDRIKPGTKLKIPGVPDVKGDREWGDALKKFGVNSNQLYGWFGQGVLPALKKSGVSSKNYKGLLDTYTAKRTEKSTFYEALNERLGTGLGKSDGGNRYNSKTRKALMHALQHTYGRPHDEVHAYSPWRRATPLEQAITGTEQDIAKEKQWQGYLTKIATWGYDDLVQHLLDKGREDGFTLAAEASKKQAYAKYLNEQIKIRGQLSAEDFASILKMLSYMQSSKTPGGPGLRDVARKVGLSDYNTVSLWEKGNEQKRFATLNPRNRTQMDTDVASYRQGTYYFASGGKVPGTGSGDTVPAMLTPGEFVIKKSAAKALGLENLMALNGAQKFALGGEVLAPSVAGIPRAATATAVPATAANSAPTYVDIKHETTYDVDIHNPVAEQGTYSMTKMLQRQSALKMSAGQKRDEDSRV